MEILVFGACFIAAVVLLSVVADRKQAEAEAKRKCAMVNYACCLAKR